MFGSSAPVCSITKIYLLPDLVLFRSFMCSRTRLDSLNRKKQYSNSSENGVVPWISLSPCHCTQYFIRFSSWIFLSSFDVFRAVGEGHAAPAQPLVGRGARGGRHEDGRAQGLGVDVLVASPCVDDIKFYKIMYIYIIYICISYRHRCCRCLRCFRWIVRDWVDWTCSTRVKYLFQPYAGLWWTCYEEFS